MEAGRRGRVHAAWLDMLGITRDGIDGPLSLADRILLLDEEWNALMEDEAYKCEEKEEDDNE